MNPEPMMMDTDPEMPILERQDIEVAAGPGPSSSVVLAPNQYEVEELIGKRWSSEFGTYQYLVKWKGYSRDESTWENFEGLDCPDVLKKFEKDRLLPLIIKLERVPVREPTGFEAGFWPKGITAITHREPEIGKDRTASLFYKVEWDGDRQPEYICSEDLVERVPMMVLVYLQSLVDMCIPPNDCTKEDQKKKYGRAKEECKKKMAKEAKKAKKLWAKTTKAAAD